MSRLGITHGSRHNFSPPRISAVQSGTERAALLPFLLRASQLCVSLRKRRLVLDEAGELAKRKKERKEETTLRDASSSRGLRCRAIFPIFRDNHRPTLPESIRGSSMRSKEDSSRQVSHSEGGKGGGGLTLGKDARHCCFTSQTS